MIYANRKTILANRAATAHRGKMFATKGTSAGRLHSENIVNEKTRVSTVAKKAASAFFVDVNHKVCDGNAGT